MKTIKNLKSLIITLGVCVAISSCKKESLIPAESGDSYSKEPIESGDPGNGERMMGCVLMNPIDYDKLPKAEEIIGTESFPSSVSLPCPSIGDQGGEGSCTAWGTAYAARSIMEKLKTGAAYSKSTNIFSPEYVFDIVHAPGAACDIVGISIPSALSLMGYYTGSILNKGVCTWNKLPYVAGSCDISNITSSARNDAKNNCITGYSTVTKSVSAFKSQLSNGKPVIIGIKVDNAFNNLNWPGEYTSFTSAPNQNGHCICVVGYDDSKNSFKVMNSWGIDWGNFGYCYIDYSLISTSAFLKEAYVIDAVL